MVKRGDRMPLTNGAMGYVYLPVKDIVTAIFWYQKNLNTTLIRCYMNRGSLIAKLKFDDNDDCNLVLVETVNDMPLRIIRNFAQFPVFCFSHPDVDKLYEHLKSNHVEITDMRENEYKKTFTFYDCAGNLLEVINQ
jgi:hypothetical protein